MIDLAIDSRIFLTEEIDLAVQELDVLFNTENTQLLGMPDFGSNFEQFLWQLYPSVNELKKYIDELIFNKTIFLKKFEVNIEVQILDGETRKIYLVGIEIFDGTGEQRQRVYQFR